MRHDVDLVQFIFIFLMMVNLISLISKKGKIMNSSTMNAIPQISIINILI